MNQTTADEQNDVLRDCGKRLEELKISYMLTGSMALVHYAIPRTTTDIDIVIELSLDNVEKFIKAFEPDYYVPHSRIRDAIYRNRMFNLLNQQTIFKIDCVIRKDDEFNIQAFSRRKFVKYTNDFDIWIIEKEDLILSKLNWAKTSHSEMQMRDVASILRNSYDADYVNEWTEKLGLTDLLAECFAMLEKNYVDGHDSWNGRTTKRTLDEKNSARTCRICLWNVCDCPKSNYCLTSQKSFRTRV